MGRARHLAGVCPKGTGACRGTRGWLRWGGCLAAREGSLHAGQGRCAASRASAAAQPAESGVEFLCDLGFAGC